METNNNSNLYQAYFSVDEKSQNPRKGMRESELNKKEILFQQIYNDLGQSIQEWTK